MFELYDLFFRDCRGPLADMANFSHPAETAENDKVANPQGVVILPNKWKYAFSSYFPGAEPSNWPFISRP